jgi:hypothetical protein
MPSSRTASIKALVPVYGVMAGPLVNIGDVGVRRFDATLLTKSISKSRELAVRAALAAINTPPRFPLPREGCTGAALMRSVRLQASLNAG